MFKHLKALFLLRPIAKAYKDEKGKDKPVYLSRRFIGSILTFGVGVYAVYTGDQLDFDVDATVAALDNVFIGFTAVYGTVMSIIGQVEKGK